MSQSPPDDPWVLIDAGVSGQHIIGYRPSRGSCLWALCEVQGYVYAAYIGRAAIALTYGDKETADRCTAQAAKIKEVFNKRFWCRTEAFSPWLLTGIRNLLTPSPRT